MQIAEQLAEYNNEIVKSILFYHDYEAAGTSMTPYLKPKALANMREGHFEWLHTIVLFENKVLRYLTQYDKILQAYCVKIPLAAEIWLISAISTDERISLKFHMELCRRYESTCSGMVDFLEESVHTYEDFLWKAYAWFRNKC